MIPKQCIACPKVCSDDCPVKPDRLHALSNPETVTLLIEQYSEPVTGVGC
jgi:hypothetical protein